MHDFQNFPELTNSQMDFYYFQSPHKQIFEDFRAKVVKVHDGDTITLRWNERDFDFPLRFIGTNAPELNEVGGERSKNWLESRLQGEMVDIIINNQQRVGKFGRILGEVIHGGRSVNQESMDFGFATTFKNRNEGKIPSVEETFAV